MPHPAQTSLPCDAPPAQLPLVAIQRKGRLQILAKLVPPHRVGSLLVAALLSACASMGLPYAEIEGYRGAGRSDAYEESVRILAIDGKAILNGSLSERIEPGQHMVVLASARRDPRGKAKGMLAPLKAKPCMRYHFAARHESMTLHEPWTLVLKQVEPIPECQARPPVAAGTKEAK